MMDRLGRMVPVAIGIVIATCGFSFPSQALADDPDPRIEAVKKYLLEEDYPELFGDDAYRMQVRDIVMGDLDGDKQEEVVFLVSPHYLQSPTILIFQVDRKLKVKRVTEGLAPGPIVPLVSDFLDSHTLGAAVDLTLGEKQGDPLARKKFVKISLDNGFGGVVEYRNFFHMDHRSGKGMYIDMRHLSLPPNVQSCENMQFSAVDAITIATKKNEAGNYLMAMVGETVYVYDIRKITEDGFLDKEMSIIGPVNSARRLLNSASAVCAGVSTYEIKSDEIDRRL